MRIERVAVAAGALFVLLTFGAEAQALECPAGSSLVDVSFDEGTRWELCWEERAEEGIVFREAHFTPRFQPATRVLQEASLAQLHLVYDDDRARRHLVTEDGLGGESLVALTSEHCPDGVLLSSETATSGARAALCQRVAARGYAIKYYSDVTQGQWLELFSVARTGGFTWIVRWRFYDDGSIEPGIGLTGRLEEFGDDATFGEPVGPGAAGGRGPIAVGWTATTYWRLDFGVGEDAGDDFVERFEVVPVDSTKEFASARITVESGETLDSQLKRSWRVLDEVNLNSERKSMSYHLEPLQAGHAYRPKTSAGGSEDWTRFDLAITRGRACERFASQNPTAGGCGADLGEYLDGEAIDGADVVLWYRTTFHHLPRDEDAPAITTRWQSFLVIPRDWTSNNPLAWLQGLVRGRWRS